MNHMHDARSTRFSNDNVDTLLMDRARTARTRNPVLMHAAELEGRAEDRAIRQRIPANVRLSRVRVWDLPTRLFHWLLVLCVSAAIVTAQLGGNWMEWHMRFGTSTLALLVFRLVWGLCGPRYARFRSFLYSPRVVLSYLRSAHAQHTFHIGHSPSAAVWVFVALVMLAMQSVTGLFSSDSISTEGPLVRFGTEEVISTATRLHVLAQWLIYALVGLHITVVVGLRLIKHQDLIRPMLTGDKDDVVAREAEDGPLLRTVGAALMAVLLLAALSLL